MNSKAVLRDSGIVIGIFTIIGVGLGITGYISVDLVQNIFSGGESEFARSIFQLFVALVFLQSVFTAFFLGPIVGGIVGTYIGAREETAIESLIVGGFGSFIGFYPMILISIYIMAAAFEPGTGAEGGQQIDIWQYLDQIVILAVPTGLVGALSSGLIGWNNVRARMK